MSDEQKMIDFSHYDGDYQAGELITKDGQTIDMDEIEKGPPKVPIFIKILGLLLLAGFGAGMYYFFSKKPPEPPPPPQPKVVIDKTVDNALALMRKSKKEDFYPLVLCWELLVTIEAKKFTEPLSIETIEKYCKPQKGESKNGKSISVKPYCSSDKCERIMLESCRNGKCTKEEKISYLDFIYTYMMRVISGFELLQAYVRYYQDFEEKRKDLQLEYKLEKSKNPGKEIRPPEKLKEIEKKLEFYKEKIAQVVDGKKNPLPTEFLPYFSLPKDKLLEQVLVHLKKLNYSSVSESKGEKRRKKRRRRRRKSRKKMTELWGGYLVGWGDWPVEIIRRSFKNLLTVYFENYKGTPFKMLDKAFDLGHLNYSPATINFWTNYFVRFDLHSCARKVKGSLSKFKLSFEVDTKEGKVIKESVKVVGKDEKGADLICIEELFKSDISYPSIPTDTEKKKISFDILLFKNLPTTQLEKLEEKKGSN